MYGAMEEMLWNKKKYREHAWKIGSLFFILIFLVGRNKKMSFL